MFTAARRSVQDNGGVAGSVVASFVLHAGLVAAFLALRAGPPPAAPPYYRVNLVAAKASDVPAAGVVQPKVTPPPEATKTPPRPKTNEVAPTPVPQATQTVERRATPSVSNTRADRNAPAPVAGGGQQGGTGADVTTIRTEGIDFPYPGYLDNIVRQIRLRFRPPPRSASLKAEVMFLIRRDGSVSGFRFTQRSGAYTFDLEVQGAVESAAAAFGPLPAGFRDDVLPVMFSFDPRLLR